MKEITSSEFNKNSNNINNIYVRGDKMTSLDFKKSRRDRKMSCFIKKNVKNSYIVQGPLSDNVEEKIKPKKKNSKKSKKNRGSSEINESEIDNKEDTESIRKITEKINKMKENCIENNIDIKTNTLVSLDGKANKYKLNLNDNTDTTNTNETCENKLTSNKDCIKNKYIDVKKELTSLIKINKEIFKKKDEPVRKKKDENEVYDKQKSELISKTKDDSIIKKKEELHIKKKDCTLIQRKDESKKKVDTPINKKEESIIKHKEESIIKKKDDSFIKNKEESIIKYKEESFIKKKEESIIKKKEESFIKNKEESIIKYKEESFIKKKEESIVKKKEENSTKKKEELIIKKKEESFIKNKEESIIKYKEESFIKKKEETSIKKKEDNSIKKKKNNDIKANEIFKKKENIKPVKEIILNSDVSMQKETIRNISINDAELKNVIKDENSIKPNTAQEPYFSDDNQLNIEEITRKFAAMEQLPEAKFEKVKNKKKDKKSMIQNNKFIRPNNKFDSQPHLKNDLQQYNRNNENYYNRNDSNQAKDTRKPINQHVKYAYHFNKPSVVPVTDSSFPILSHNQIAVNNYPTGQEPQNNEVPVKVPDNYANRTKTPYKKKNSYEKGSKKPYSKSSAHKHTNQLPIEELPIFFDNSNSTGLYAKSTHSDISFGTSQPYVTNSQKKSYPQQVKPKVKVNKSDQVVEHVLPTSCVYASNIIDVSASIIVTETTHVVVPVSTIEPIAEPYAKKFAYCREDDINFDPGQFALKSSTNFLYQGLFFIFHIAMQNFILIYK